MSFSVKITIQSDTRYLAPLRGLVGAVAKIAGRRQFPMQARRSCTLALIEAVDNAIFHAHRHRKSLPIDVALTVGNGRVFLKVADKGGGLNHLTIRDPNLTSTRGRGLYLMRRLMGNVKSRKTKSGHSMTMTYNVRRDSRV